MDTIIMLMIFIILALIGFWAVEGCYKLNEKEGREKEMKKIYKGYELLKAIADGEIYYGTKFKIKDWNEIVVYEQCNLIFRETFDTKEEGSNYGETIFDLWNLDYILDLTFELIEDEVDIESIEEFKIDENNFIQTELGAFKTRKMDIAFLNKINEVIQAVNQHDKEIKELKSLDIEISEKDINEAIKKAREERNKEIKSIKEK